MKRTESHRQAWVGCRRSKREGKKEWDLASHFVDRLNKSIKARWSTLIELHKWDRGYTWQSCYKAATSVGRGFRHFLKLIIHAGPSLLFFYPLICPSVFPVLVCLFNSSSHPFWSFCSVARHLSLLYTAPLINETVSLPLSVCLHSHFLGCKSLD